MERTPSKERAADTTRAAASAPQRPTFDELQGQIRLKLSGLPRESLASPANKRWVIASLLSWELYEGSRNEPKFAALVLGVQQSIDADAHLRATFERLMDDLSG